MTKNLYPQIRVNVIETICDYFGLNVSQVKTPTKGRREVCECRQLIYFFLWKYKVGSLQEIGREMQRDHTSILHGIKMVNNLSSIDVIFKKNMNNIEERVREIINDKVCA